MRMCKKEKKEGDRGKGGRERGKDGDRRRDGGGGGLKGSELGCLRLDSSHRNSY